MSVIIFILHMKTLALRERKSFKLILCRTPKPTLLNIIGSLNTEMNIFITFSQEGPIYKEAPDYCHCAVFPLISHEFDLIFDRYLQQEWDIFAFARLEE